MLWSDGNINQNVFNCLVSGGPPPFADQDVLDDMEDWLDNMYANLTATTTDELDGNEVLVYKYDTGDQDWDDSRMFFALTGTLDDYLLDGVTKKLATRRTVN